MALVVSFFNVPFAAIVSIVAGTPFAAGAAGRAVRDRRIDVNVLMVLAALAAVVLGHAEEAAVLLFLFSLSSTLEEYAMARTKSAIEGLIKLRPDSALVVRGEVESMVPLGDVQVGDIVRVRPFENVPLDGVVESGQTSVDQAAMTGESKSVAKVSGDSVLGGTQNLDGMVLVRVTRATGESTLDKIVALVEDAQENKASGEKIAGWFGQTYTLLVMAAFVVSVGVRMLLRQPLDHAMYASLTLFVALSPCALVIATPATTLSALAWCAKNGMLVRGGQFIELAGKVKTVVFDKTGTLTEGTPQLAEICVCGQVPAGVGAQCQGDACWSSDGPMSDESKRLLRLAAAAEQYSTHPIAEAVLSAAKDQNIEVPEATSSKAVAGLGVVAEVDGQTVRVGQPKFFEGEQLPTDFEAHVSEIRARGMTVAVMESGGEWAALGMMDGPRHEAVRALEEFRKIGVSDMRMLTGDNRDTAEAIGKQIGITNIEAGLLPQDKETSIAKLESASPTMFVGDGINDAPSLARASVGVAMGGLGSDVALNAADVVLIQDNLMRLPELVRLGRKTNRTIAVNLTFATLVIAGLTVGTMLLDWLRPGSALLPMAVVGHEGSTVLVILNGLRLLRGP